MEPFVHVPRIAAELDPGWTVGEQADFTSPGGVSIHVVLRRAPDGLDAAGLAASHRDTLVSRLDGFVELSVSETATRAVSGQERRLAFDLDGCPSVGRIVYFVDDGVACTVSSSWPTDNQTADADVDHLLAGLRILAPPLDRDAVLFAGDPSPDATSTVPRRDPVDAGSWATLRRGGRAGWSRRRWCGADVGHAMVARGAAGVGGDPRPAGVPHGAQRPAHGATGRRPIGRARCRAAFDDRSWGDRRGRRTGRGGGRGLRGDRGRARPRPGVGDRAPATRRFDRLVVRRPVRHGGSGRPRSARERGEIRAMSPGVVLDDIAGVTGLDGRAPSSESRELGGDHLFDEGSGIAAVVRARSAWRDGPATVGGVVDWVEHDDGSVSLAGRLRMSRPATERIRSTVLLRSGACPPADRTVCARSCSPTCQGREVLSPAEGVLQHLVPRCG